MLMDPMGGIVMTNDGNAILREVCFDQNWFIKLFERIAACTMIDSYSCVGSVNLNFVRHIIRVYSVYFFVKNIWTS